MLTKAYIPYRGYYSTPFVRWQGTLANEHSIILGATGSVCGYTVSFRDLHVNIREMRVSG